MKKTESKIMLVISLSFLLGAFLYSSMPDMMASNWNVEGGVNGYIPKFWGLFLMPLITLGLFIMFVTLPAIDPLKRNVAKFRGTFDKFILVTVLFMLFLYVFTLLWNLGYAFNITFFIVPAMAVLFFYAGVLMEKSRRNWFIGIKTPWTMSSDRVWDKTNKLGGRLFKASAVISLVGLLFPVYSLCFLIIPVMASSVYVVAYSFFEYNKRRK